jgi:heme exporter protein A
LDVAPLVVASNLTRRFGATTALDDVSLTVRRGEPLALFGANGAGKSTLLRVISGSMKPTGGSVTIDGRDPRRNGAGARGTIGLLSHQTLLYDDLSAFENLVFFARLHGLADPESRAHDLLGAAGLADRAADPIRNFSRGMQQRVALARALVHEPPLLLLDEPSSGLDATASAKLHEALRAAASRGATWVLASHDVELGLALCTRWVAMRRGRVLDGGTTSGQDADRVRELMRGAS